MYVLIDWCDKTGSSIIDADQVKTRLKREKLCPESWSYDEPVLVKWPLSFDAATGRKYNGQQTSMTARIVAFGSLDVLKSQCKVNLKRKKMSEGESDVEAEAAKTPKLNSKVKAKTKTGAPGANRPPAGAGKKKTVTSKVKKAAGKQIADDAKKRLLKLKQTMEDQVVKKSKVVDLTSSELDAEELSKVLDEKKRKSEIRKPDEDVSKKEDKLEEQDSNDETDTETIKELEKFDASMYKKQYELEKKRREKLELQLLQASQSKSSQPVSSGPGYSGATATKLVKGVASFGVDEGKVDLGKGVKVDIDNFQTISISSPKDTVYSLAEEVFGSEYMATHTPTGRRSNAFPDKAPKGKLDMNSVEAIVSTARKIWPKMKPKQIHKYLGAKCQIAAKSTKRNSEGKKKEKLPMPEGEDDKGLSDSDSSKEETED